MEKTETEFDLLVQRTKQRVVLGERILETVRLFQSHPILLKEYLSGRLSLENFVIYDKIFHFSKNFDKKLTDPVWETVSLKLKKYGPFINIDVFKYKKLLRSIVNE